MGYSYDIFISYRRDDETRQWMATHLVPLMNLHLGQALHRKARIFVDDQLETGVFWPAELGRKLARSRVLVPLWAGDYLASKWCRAELNAMVARQKATSGASTPRSLIVPFIIHDGETMPKSLRGTQLLRVDTCFNVRMAKDSVRAEHLAAVIQESATGLSKAIKSAPKWDRAWLSTSAADFNETFRAKRARQRKPPRFGD